MTDIAQIPRTPPRLGKTGRALWRRILTEYDLDTWELVLFEAACRQADDIARLEQLLTDDGITTTGSTGQTRLSAALTEVRLSRAALAKLLDQLHLPAQPQAVTGPQPVPADPEPGKPGESGKSRRARKAAEQRWRKARDRKEARGGAASAG